MPGGLTRVGGRVAAALLAVGAVGQVPADALRHRLIESRNVRAFERELRAAASDRFRLLGAIETRTLDGEPLLVALMKSLGDEDSPSDHAVFAPRTELEDPATLRALNALGAGGYRLAPRGILTHRVDDWWLPESAYTAQLTLILERSAIPGRHEYDSLRFRGEEEFQRDLAERRREGFRVLALANSGRRVRAILGRPLDSASGRATGREPYRLLHRAIRNGMRDALNRAAREGYQVVAAADPSINAPPLVLLERSASVVDTPRYRVLRDPVDKQRKSKLERALNGHAAEGFRLLPQAVTRSTLILERDPRTGRPRHYLALSSRRPPGLARALDEAEREGYRFTALLADSVETIALVERPIAPDSQ